MPIKQNGVGGYVGKTRFVCISSALKRNEIILEEFAVHENLTIYSK